MEKDKQQAKENYQLALEAINRLLYGNGKRGVSIKEINMVFSRYNIEGKDRVKILNASALKYL